MDGPNAAQAERWGGAGGRHWVDHEAGYDRQLAAYGAALLDAAALTEREHVLDVGCGTGTTALAAAAQAAWVLGVDLSPMMIGRATARAQGVTNVTFRVADAQTATFAPPVDVIISRFGLMFFADPRAAFANLRAATRPGGRLCTVCWQALERNEWMRVPGEALARVVPLADLAEPGQPGPFALASPADLRAVLGDAGWTDVGLEEVTSPVPVGGAFTLDDVMTWVRGSSLGRSALTGVDPETERRALDSVREALAPRVTDEGVVLPGAAWLVRARRAS